MALKSWPFKESDSLAKQLRNYDGVVRFETGFGPSGLPHIGTFAEVARTTWVRRAFEHITGKKTELIAFSDDMDGLRKVPLNMPNKEMLREHLGEPLSRIPDPFGCCESYSDHMNGKLREFLDRYEFDYRFQSSAEAYSRGDFDEGLRLILEKHDEIRDVVAPTLREENRKDWSPIMPICPKCGKVYTTRVLEVHPENGTVLMKCDKSFGDVHGCGHEGEVNVTGGNVKVGWKVDWALRWYSYGIHYEMYGKDLIESAKLSARICRILGGRPPVGLVYEMFLDENGEKISKSVGKGVTVDAWMEYAPLESLLYYIFQNPKKAKRLFFGMIPKVVDDYLAELKRYPTLAEEKKPDSAVWHVHGGNPPAYGSSITFSLINNLISGLGTDDEELLWTYLKKYDPQVEDYENVVRALVTRSLAFYRDFILPNKKYEKPDRNMRYLFEELRNELGDVSTDASAEDLQAIPFDIARRHDVDPKEFFKAIYGALLGQERGPRFGTFAKLMGRDKVLELIDKALA